MIIDSFLFFQELDLLEIRLNYLYPYVDKFIIIEACQSFNGKIKNFNFENNHTRFKKYSDKICYYKINDFHNSSNELFQYLSNHKNPQKRLIFKFLEKHNHYNKNHIWWVLDSYHRECIHLALNKYCKPKDLIIISDLDEIPSFKSLDCIKRSLKQNYPLVFKQYEFKYYLNSLNSKNWLGSIISPYSQIRNRSFNLLRRESFKLNKINSGGFHFTSVGGEKALKEKIENWSHQEFNIPEVKNNLKINLLNGRDIFYRFGIKKNKILDINNNSIIDDRMKNIIANYRHLHIQANNKESFIEFLKYKYIQLKLLLMKIKNNPLKLLKKIKYIIRHFIFDS